MACNKCSRACHGRLCRHCERQERREADIELHGAIGEQESDQ